MWKKIAILAVASLAARACERWWTQSQHRHQHRHRKEHREAVQRWEDEGGALPAVAPAPREPTATQRRRKPSSAATKMSAKSRPLQAS